MDPESLFCMMLQNVYTSIVALIEGALALPLVALQILESALQMVEYVIFAAIDIALTAVEEMILKLFDLENANLEKARRNFCRIAYECVALTNYLFGPSSPLLAISSPAEIAAMKTNYSKFEEIVCQGSFRALLDKFKSMLLADITALLSELTDKLDKANAKITKLRAKYMKALNESGIYDALNKLDDFAQCAFAACDFISTGDNKQTDTMDKLKLTKDGNNYSLNNELLGSYYKMQSSLEQRIADLRSWSTKCANKEPNPKNGIPLDELA